VLDESTIPVTYVNVAAYYSDNLVRLFGAGLAMHGALCAPYNHRMAWVDPSDVGECLAAVLLSPDERHLGKTYHLDNGQDILTFDEVAALVADVVGRPVAYDESLETFLGIARLVADALTGDAEMAWAFAEYLRFEAGWSTVWRRTDIVDYLLGRPGKTLRSWIEDNAAQLRELLAASPAPAH
jgi:uncharacterized protein YbjT (DUF2867 family)